jgi:hypothetical protein
VIPGELTVLDQKHRQKKRFEFDEVRRPRPRPRPRPRDGTHTLLCGWRHWDRETMKTWGNLSRFL